MVLSLCLVGTFNLSANAANTDVITVVTVNGQNSYANSDHLTLYTFDKDQTSVSTCYNGCAKAWPPVLLPAGAVVQTPIATSARTDGSLQITINGKPVYLYAGDDKEGDITGDGIGGIWHLIKAE